MTATREEDAADRKLLLVDDDRDAAEALAALLEMEGWSVEVAFDAASALAALGRRDFAVLLVDLILPDASGFDVAREAMAEAPGHPPFLVALSGRGDPASRRRALEMGFRDFLVKPVSLDELSRSLAVE